MGAYCDAAHADAASHPRRDMPSPALALPDRHAPRRSSLLTPTYRPCPIPSVSTSRASSRQPRPLDDKPRPASSGVKPNRHASTVLARPCDIPSQTVPSLAATPFRHAGPSPLSSGRQDESPRAHAKPTCRPRVAYVPIPSDIPIRLLSGRLAESPHATPTCLPNAARRRTARQPSPAREAPPSTPSPCDRP